MGFITAVRGPDAARDPIKTCEGSPFNRWAAFLVIKRPKGDVQMPIKIPESLPAAQTLLNENIFVMDEHRAARRDIRPLQVALLNLMPTDSDRDTVREAARQHTSSGGLTLLQTATYEAKNTSRGIFSYYQTFDQVTEGSLTGLS